MGIQTVSGIIIKRKTEMQLNYSSGPFALQELFTLQRLATKIWRDHPVLSTTM